MSIHVSPLDLDFAVPFGIARNTKTVTRNVLVTIKNDGIVAYGEGAPNSRYDETQESASAALNRFLETKIDLKNLTLAGIESIMEEAEKQMPKEASARAALDIALHDYVAKKAGRPLYELWGYDPSIQHKTSFTIGIAAPEIMAERAAEASDKYDILKIKVGNPQDQESIAALRKVTLNKIRVDANEGWKTKEEALEKILWLNEMNVELVEQPMPAGRLDDMAWLKERSPIPLIADEDCTANVDYAELARGFDCINIKLDKCGGLAAGRKMLIEAKKHGLSIFLGCMGSSSVSISAAGHLALAADYADLDGHLLIRNDPFTGIQVVDGRLVLDQSPGIGVRPI